MMQQTPEPPQPPEFSHSMQYFIGIGIGVIPIIFALLGFSNSAASALFSIALALYVAQLIAAILCMISHRIRFVGYGLLTMVFIAPFAVFIGCIVMISNHP